MKLPAASCLFWPQRFFPCNEMKKPDYKVHEIRFYEPDDEKFPAIKIAREVMKDMKNNSSYPAVLIGADEVAVDLFLKGKIKFTDIASLVAETLSAWNMPGAKSLDDMIDYVDLARRKALELGPLRSSVRK